MANGAYLYPTVVQPLLPTVVPPTPPNLANWYDARPQFVYPKPTSVPAIEIPHFLAEPVFGNIIVNVFQDTTAIITRPAAYLYETQARPVLSQPFVPGAVTNAAVINPQPNMLFKSKDMTGALANIMRSLGGLAGKTPIDQYHWLDQIPQLLLSKYPVAALQTAMVQSANIAPITVTPFISLISSYIAEYFPQWQKASQVALQAVNSAYTSNIFPLPFSPTPILMSDWWVDNLPWVPPAKRFDLGAIEGSYTPLETLVNPITVAQLGWRIEPLFINRYPSQNANIETYVAYTPNPPEQIQQPRNFVVPQFDVWPKFRPANYQALEALFAQVQNIFPLPTSVTPAVPAPIFQDPPAQRKDPALNIAALILAAVGGKEQGLGSKQPIDQYGWRFYPEFPRFGPSAVVSTLYQAGEGRNIAPVTIPPAIASIASYFAEWFPQWQPRSIIATLQNYQADTYPIVAPPFIPVPAPTVSAYNLDVFPALLNVGRFTNLAFWNGQISPVLPQPFIPPPFVSPGCPPPTGSDVNIRNDYFNVNGVPVATLFCRICQNAIFIQGGVFQPNAFQGGMPMLPLYVRGDFAIWCPSCCAFISRENTFMSTTKAPRFFRGVF